MSEMTRGICIQCHLVGLFCTTLTLQCMISCPCVAWLKKELLTPWRQMTCGVVFEAPPWHIYCISICLSNFAIPQFLALFTLRKTLPLNLASCLCYSRPLSAKLEVCSVTPFFISLCYYELVSETIDDIQTFGCVLLFVMNTKTSTFHRAAASPCTARTSTKHAPPVWGLFTPWESWLGPRLVRRALSLLFQLLQIKNESMSILSHFNLSKPQIWY